MNVPNVCLPSRRTVASASKRAFRICPMMGGRVAFIAAWGQFSMATHRKPDPFRRRYAGEADVERGEGRRCVWPAEATISRIGEFVTQDGCVKNANAPGVKLQLEPCGCLSGGGANASGLISKLGARGASASGQPPAAEACRRGITCANRYAPYPGLLTSTFWDTLPTFLRTRLQQRLLFNRATCPVPRPHPRRSVALFVPFLEPTRGTVAARRTPGEWHSANIASTLPSTASCTV